MHSFRLSKPLTVVTIIVSALWLKPAQAAPTEITVSAAASLKDVLNTLAATYKKQQPEVTVRFNFASSGTLQRQIEQGAPVDIFISAADKNMDELAKQKLIDTATRRVLAQNQLVLVVPKANADDSPVIRSFRDLAKPTVGEVAIGAPESVPAGKYAQQLLTKLGIWNTVLRKAVQGKDVREVLTQVELGNVDAGIVYRTDAAISKRVKVVATAPASYHKPIRYPMAVVQTSHDKASAQRFLTFLSSARAKAILKLYRFVVS